MSELRDRRWIVAQIGARQHYTVPAGFTHLGRLERFYTDAWCAFGGEILKRCGRAARNLAGRYSSDVPSSRVVSFTGRTLFREASRGGAGSRDRQYREYIAEGKRFATSVNRHLRTRLSAADELAYFSFNTGCLETIRMLRDSGVPTVVDQIDPARVEEQIVLEEIERWPGWQQSPGRIPDCYFDRLSSEWIEADGVFVNSEWCRTALIQQGISADKISVAPIAFGRETDPTPASRRIRSAVERRPLRVLWLGQVNLRKGIPYLIEAARLISSQTVEVRVVGPLSISETVLKSAPPNVRFDGPIARIDAAEAYDWADVFVLPTLSDGFAITQLEAMSRGLPVVTTPNCGDVVSDGKDGVIVPIRDANSLADALVQLADDRQRLNAMSEQAIRTVREFSMERVAQRRLDAICDAYERISCAV